MSTLLLDSRAHADAVKAAVGAALGLTDPQGNPCAYDYGDVPGFDGNLNGADNKPLKQPGRFALVAVDFIPSGNQRMSAQTGNTRWRVSVRGVGRTVDEARWVLFHAATVLHEKSLTIEGRLTTPLQGDPGQAPRPDGDHRYSGLSAYTYTH